MQRPEILIGARTPEFGAELQCPRDLAEGVSEFGCVPDVQLRPGQYSIRPAIFD
jgi:hypothetical protein